MNLPVAGDFNLPVKIHTVTVDRSGHWLMAAWGDFRKAPVVSLIYGGVFTFGGLILAFGLIRMDLGSLILPLIGGFALVSPILAVGLYEISRRIESGRPIQPRSMCDSCLRNAGQVAAMGVVLLIIHFFWIIVAIFLFALFFGDQPPPLHSFLEDVVFSMDGAPFLIIGTLLGALLAAGVFAASAVSIPLLLDRDFDVVTAIAVSLIAVRANWRVMFGWAALIALIIGVGVATFFVGLVVGLPLLGYATWHAYRDIVEPLVPAS